MGSIYYNGVKFGETGSSDGSGIVTKVPDFDAANSYVIGEYVVYDGVVYKCVSDTSEPAGGWADTLWQSVGISGDISAYVSVHIADYMRY